MMALGVLAPFASPASAQALDFAPGDTVVTTDVLNMRTGPGTATAVTDVLPSGTVGTVTDGPVVGPDWTWFEISVPGVDTGWVAGEFLALAEEDEVEFPLGSVVFVDADAVNVRDEAGLDGDVIGLLVSGDLATVTDAPVTSDGYDWYRVASGSTVGWVAGEFLALADASSDFPIGSVVAVNTDILNVRAEPGLDGRVVDTISFAELGEVSRDPVEADGYTWYRLRLANAADGWVAGDFLVLYGSGDLTFPIGTFVRVDTDILNVRAEPGLDGRIVDAIGFGAVGEVSRDAVEADGYVWYRLRIANAADGWVAGEFLVAA
jgi:uncharacterized protein YgiM (DUF1202 family)